MLSRVFALLSARLAGGLTGDRTPVGPLFLHAALSAALALLVRGDLAAFPYAVLMLALSGTLVALSLLGELGGVLRADPAAEWIGAQPLRARELALARVLLALALLAVLALGALVPAALLAPSGAGLLARVGLVAAGIAQAVLVAALLLLLETALGERTEGLLVLLQTALVGLTVLGMLLVPGLIGGLASLAPGSAAPQWLARTPPAWFARLAGFDAPVGLPPAALPLALSLLALVALALLPPPAQHARRRGGSPLGKLLAPLYALALRGWVTRREAAGFQLVWQALPREREFVLRTYPMLGIPLAILLLGARDPYDAATLDLLAVLCWTPAVYLPVLLAHVPATRTPEASWLLESSPNAREDIGRGARKAVLLRFVLPLHLLLAAVAVSIAGAHGALAPAVQGLFVSALSLRILYPRFVHDLPLSIPPERVEVRQKLAGIIPTLAMLLPVAAIFARRGLDTPARGAAFAAALLAAEALFELSERRASVAQLSRDSR